LVVIPAKAGIQSFQGILDSRFCGSDGECGFFRNLINPKVFSQFGVFEPLDFEFVSDFDMRILDFSIRQTCAVSTMPGQVLPE
jgi:hypothetical protein